jgi:7-cyano-7-deazaguanine synthase
MIESCSVSELAVLLSGGLDSAVLAGLLAQQGKIVHPIYVRTGLHWETVELQWLHIFLEKLCNPGIRAIKEVSLPVEDVYGGHWSITGENIPGFDSPDEGVYLPGRNLLLLSKSVLYCAANNLSVLALGLLKGNPFGDSSPEFLTSFEEAAGLALNFSFRFWAPFRNFSKCDVIGMGCHFPLEFTFSCIHPVHGYHCGNCNKCAERQHAFAMAGVKDKTVYRTPLRSGELVENKSEDS